MKTTMIIQQQKIIQKTTVMVKNYKHQDTCVKCEVNFSTLDPTAGHGCVGPLSYCKSCFLLNKDKDCVLRQNQLGEDSEMPSTI